MIASVDRQTDLEVFLEVEEVACLERETIEGVLVKHAHEKRQGTISLQIDDTQSTHIGFGVGVNDKEYWGVPDNFRIELFMATSVYNDLKQRGCIGLRHRMKDGAKVHVYNRSRISSMERHTVESLEYYRDNRGQLPEEVYG